MDGRNSLANVNFYGIIAYNSRKMGDEADEISFDF